ncbi:ABC transporter substrate-binding protein [Candidatus Bipolaricaulota bacterium]|nr:ABC transporter substrate-binding protein [Candidatus Bipolaricaulota bacterium]
MKNYQKLFSIGVVLVLTSVLLFAGMASANEDLEPTGKPVVIGSISPLTGAAEIEGTDIQRGEKIALKEINEAGGVLGRPLKIVWEDSETQPKSGVDAAHKLVETNEVPVILGSYSSGVTLPISEYTNKKGVVQISEGSTSPALRDVGPYLFNAVGLDDLMGTALANFAMKDTGQKKFSIIVMNNPFGIGMARWMRKTVEEAGGEILSEVRYERFKSDYRAELRELYKPDPPAILYSIYGKETKVIRKQAYELDLESEFGWYAGYTSMGTSAAIPETVEGTKGLSPGYLGAAAADFNDKYEDRYGELPPSCWASYGYDATWLAALAINSANSTDPDKIKEALHQIAHRYRGVSGGGNKIFDENGMQVQETYITQIYEDGKLHPYTNPERGITESKITYKKQQ